jgi:hypothetical protein
MMSTQHAGLKYLEEIRSARRLVFLEAQKSIDKYITSAPPCVEVATYETDPQVFDASWTSDST